MAGQNHHRATSQNSITLQEESRHDGEIVNFDYVASYDEIGSPSENAVDEREDEFESFETEHEVSNDQNENEDEVEEEKEDIIPLAFVKASEYCLFCRARFPVFDSINQLSASMTGVIQSLLGNSDLTNWIFYGKWA
ncbi:hypothetical protein ACHAO8_007290 [Botrytis cinerea]